MGIGDQGEACGKVTQHAADGLNVYAVLQGEGCEGVTEVIESDLRDACPLQNSLQHIVHAVRGDGPTVGGGEHILVMGLGFLLIEELLSPAVRWSQRGRSSLFSAALLRSAHPLSPPDV